MKWEELDEAVCEAQQTLNLADDHVRSMAKMVIGRLQQADVRNSVLTALKKELRDYNIHTGKWKKRS